MLLNVVVPIVHVAACVFLIVVVLLQTGKGADMGAVFGGGGSQTLFGSTGAGNLLTKLTTAMAVTFMLTSLTLAVSHQDQRGSGLLDRIPDTAQPIPPPPHAATEAPVDVAGSEPGTETPAAEEPAAATAEAPASEAPGRAAPEPGAPATPDTAPTP